MTGLERRNNTRETSRWPQDPELPRTPPPRPAPNSPPAPWQLDPESPPSEDRYVMRNPLRRDEPLSLPPEPPVGKPFTTFGQGVLIVLVAAAAAVLVIEFYPQA